MRQPQLYLTMLFAHLSSSIFFFLYFPRTLLLGLSKIDCRWLILPRPRYCHRYVPKRLQVADARDSEIEDGTGAEEVSRLGAKVPVGATLMWVLRGGGSFSCVLIGVARSLTGKKMLWFPASRGSPGALRTRERTN